MQARKKKRGKAVRHNSVGAIEARVSPSQSVRIEKRAPNVFVVYIEPSHEPGDEAREIDHLLPLFSS